MHSELQSQQYIEAIGPVGTWAEIDGPHTEGSLSKGLQLTTLLQENTLLFY